MSVWGSEAHTGFFLSASPFRQRDTTGDADRKSKRGCAHC
jgi:hypothetical protein